MRLHSVVLKWRSYLAGIVTLSLLAACNGTNIPISSALEVQTFEVSPLKVGVGDPVMIRWHVAANATEKLRCSLDVNDDRYFDYLLTDCVAKSQSHRYQEPGNYTVELLVRDAQGQETRSSKGIQVELSGPTDKLPRQSTTP